MQKALEDALLTEEEMKAGPSAWREYEDPFFGGALPKQCWDIDLNDLMVPETMEEDSSDDEGMDDEETGETSADEDEDEEMEAED